MRPVRVALVHVRLIMVVIVRVAMRMVVLAHAASGMCSAARRVAAPGRRVESGQLEKPSCGTPRYGNVAW